MIGEKPKLVSTKTCYRVFCNALPGECEAKGYRRSDFGDQYSVLAGGEEEASWPFWCPEIAVAPPTRALLELFEESLRNRLLATQLSACKFRFLRPLGSPRSSDWAMPTCKRGQPARWQPLRRGPTGLRNKTQRLEPDSGSSLQTLPALQAPPAHRWTSNFEQ